MEDINGFNEEFSYNFSTDEYIGEFIRPKLSSGLFWAGGAAEKKKPPNCHKYATFWGGFFNFLWAKFFSIRTEKLHSLKAKKILKNIGNHFIFG